jgi:hypothetical protein
VQEVAIALLGLTERLRKDRLRVLPEIQCLDDFEQEGGIEVSNTSLDWVGLTEAGQARSCEILRKHFGIVVSAPSAPSGPEGT